VAQPFDRARGWWGGGESWRRFARAALGGALLLFAARQSRADAGPDFPVPAGLAPAVRFWVDVFTRYGQDDAIIHDRVQPWVVYQVVPSRGADADVVARALEARLVLAALVPPPGVDFAEPGGDGAAPRRLRVQRGMREAFAGALAAGRLYRPIVERALRRERLPLALEALPLVESSYHPGAVSRAGAVGLWQLTRVTGEQYLKIGRGVDERRDPVRASEAAARHLRALRDELPSWPLVLTAYNHGLAGVQRARATVGSDDVGVLAARYDGPEFGFASRNYYAEFLAALHVMRHVDRYFPDLAPGRLVEYRVKRGDTLYAVARRHGVTLAALRATNGLRSIALQPGQRILIRL
jgi:peptidoglycan lytic transglycosylase D